MTIFKFKYWYSFSLGILFLFCCSKQHLKLPFVFAFFCYSKMDRVSTIFKIHTAISHRSHRNSNGLRRQSCSIIPSSIVDFMGKTLISYNLGHSFPVTAIKNISHINFMREKTCIYSPISNTCRTDFEK